jgi:CHASE2 domain
MNPAPAIAIFQLNVQQIESVCLFELTWGNGQRERVTVPYPERLTPLYQNWKDAYLNFYRSYQTILPEPQQAFRGQAAGGGIVTAKGDQQEQLVTTEKMLLLEFNRWLAHPDLRPISRQFAQTLSQLATANPVLDLLIACTPIALVKLPWEAWDINSQFATAGKIRIARMPATIHHATVEQPARIRHRPRILAIFGGGIDATVDRHWMRSLDRQVADVTILSQQPEQSVEHWKAEVVQTLKDKRGWEILFFAGHSRETEVTGGALEIAPGASIQLSELEQHLAIAHHNGLRFAIFNSCSGISIAETLIKLGIGQVAIIRERIHDHVAQDFLIQFLQALGRFQDVQNCLIAACNDLKLTKDIAYPSAYLVPSLFRHPGAALFQIPPSVGRKRLKAIGEAVGVAVAIGLSWALPVQDFLLANRLLMQAWYRNISTQTATNTFPVLMVEVDQASLERSKIQRRNPIDRQYLARLIEKLTSLDTKVIGLDYLLDSEQPGDQLLSIALQKADIKGINFVFAVDCQKGIYPKCANWLRPTADLNLPTGTALGDLRFLEQGQSATTYLPFWQQTDSAIAPFAYELAQSYTQVMGSQRSIQPPPPPGFITHLGYVWGQMWLHPIVDFSLPPQTIYQRIPAWQLLQSDANAPELRNLHQQIVMLVPGGYLEAGIRQAGEDNYPLPAATQYWRQRAQPPDLRSQLIGSELHAYLYQHFLSQRAITPIPDIWLVVFAFVVGKGTVWLIQNRALRDTRKGSPPRRQALYLLISGTLIYVIISIQAYVSIAFIIPIILPVSLYWLYVFPTVISPNP